jgi:hypothetical protein
MRRFAMNWLLMLAMVGIVVARTASADVLLDQTNVVGLPSVAAPAQFSFTASTAQALTLTLNDLQIPAAFTSLQVAVTLGDTLVGSAAISSAGTATLAIPAATGNYTLYVIGTPNATQGIGFFGVCVAPATSAKSCIANYSFAGNIQNPTTVSNSGQSTLQTNFTSSSVAGTYTVTITDDAFPMALTQIQGGISQGSNPVAALSGAGTTQIPNVTANTSYQLILAAIANSAVQAGLYGVQITDPNGTVVFNRTLPVGTLPAATIVDNTTAQALSLTLTDYGYPAPLSASGVAVTEGGAPALAALTSPGTVSNFTAPAGSVEIWQYVVAGAQPGVYGVVLSPYPAASGTVDLFSTTRVVNPSSASGGTSFAFIANLPTAGTYNLLVNDFQFPVPFTSLGTPTVAQNGTVLTQTAGGDFTGAAGPVVVLVNTTPPSSGDGIFGVTVQTSGSSPQVLLDQTQAVGGVFTTSTVTVGTSGNYSATLTDLGFPSSFQNLAVAVSRGSQVVGKIYGGGTFAFNVTPGQYVFSYITTPTTTSATASLNNYGLYAINVASSVPTLTFTASPTSVTAGQTTQLTWSSQNAISCTASGVTGWTGSEPTSGSTAVAIASNSTLTLSCTGSGGAVTKSVTVTATTAPSSGGGGGGGALSGAFLAMITATWLAGLIRTTRRMSRSRDEPLTRP